MNAWDRREDADPKETSKAYAAFLLYRDMGGQRALSRVAKALSKSETLINRWSFTHDWVSRAQAWDAEQQRLDDEARRETRERLIADELADYRMMLDKWHEVYERTKLHETRSRQTLKDGRVVDLLELNTADWQVLMKLRADIGKFGRLALGLPDRIAQDQHTGADGGAIKTVNANVEVKPDDTTDPERVAAILRILADSGALPPGISGADDAPPE